MTKPFPSFENPPVIETALGVQFSPLVGWGVPHFGLFWSTIRDEYPRFQVVSPLATEIEGFGEETFGKPSAKLELVTEPDVRCWFVHASDERLLQLQRDRFIHNWRRCSGTGAYPRYGSLRPRFETEWRRFLAFLSAEGLQEPQVVQCEVTYINHIDRGGIWDSFADLGKLLSAFSQDLDVDFLPPPETALLNLHFIMPNQTGRLRALLQHALRGTDGAETLQLTLSAKGRPTGSSVEDILAWLDRGREWVVRGFAALTTEAAHDHWGRTE